MSTTSRPDLEAFWMPFTANRQFKSHPRLLARAEGMLANDRFVSRAPEAVVEAEREKLERYRRELGLLDELERH